MKNNSENLERLYQSFFECEQPFPFFKELAIYLECVFADPTLKSEFDRQMAERRVLIEQIEATEKKVRSEMDHAKKTLLDLIEKTRLDVASFERYQTMPILEKTTIPQEIKSYEDRQSGTVFISDEIERHLFDLAANIHKAGYENELKDFLVSPKEYTHYYWRINGRNNYAYIDNIHGNFIFSETWPERWERVRHFERQRGLKLWGSFEEIFRFYIAYKEAFSENSDSVLLSTENGTEDMPWFGQSRERVSIDAMAREIRRLNENNLDFFSKVIWDPTPKQNVELKNLKQINLKSTAQIVHNQLMRVASEIDQSINSKPKMGKFVESIVCLMPKNGRQLRRVYVNREHEIEIKDSIHEKPYWDSILSLAQKYPVSYNKGLLDYFNSNKSNPIYKQTGLKPTKVLKKEHDTIASGISITAVSRRPTLPK